MKRIIVCSIIIIILFGSACSKKQVTGLLDDIARDTYENNVRKQHFENLENPHYEKPPTYDQYQKERKLKSNQD
jgi:hypothetical protein